MKDRYLYRGKQINTGEWITGHLVSSEVDGILKIFHEDEESTSLFQVEEETIGQCTGLKDKNGQLIWEGDIVSGCNGSINGYPWKWGPVEVKWNDEDAKFKMWTGGTFEKQDSTHWFEVIGNIYENKDL